MDRLANCTELAELFQVKTATIRAWARRGWIPCLRAGSGPLLFDVNEVQDALRQRGQNQTRQPTSPPDHNEEL